MELSQLNNTNTVSQVNDVNKNSRPNNLQDVKEVTQKSSSDRVEIENTLNTKSFLSNISSNLIKVADLQQQQSSISNQLEITNEIIKTTQVAVKSDTIQLDDKQPEIKNLLDSFNKLSESSKRTEISDKPGIYFDGQVGARPLSSKEINDAIEQNKTRLETVNKTISNEIKDIVSDTKDTLEVEKTIVETKVEFKKVDFEKESAQFSGQSINNFKGEVIPSQANGFPNHSEQLLA